jgi:hypothetical protein
VLTLLRVVSFVDKRGRSDSVSTWQRAGIPTAGLARVDSDLDGAGWEPDDKMFAQVAAVFGVDTEMVEHLEKLLSVDSTSVRAHQHCAGARSDTLATGGSVELQESA